MRPKNKPLSPAELTAARNMLREAPFAYFALTESADAGSRHPYLVPLNFVYLPPTPENQAATAPILEGVIYFHTGPGRKTAALSSDPHVCIAITEDVGFVQGDNACADGFSYRSLLVWGRARRLEERAEREAALRAIVAKYDRWAGGEAFGDEDFSRTLIYEVSIEEASYKERLPK